MKCKKCGSGLSADFKMCPFCGTKIETMEDRMSNLEDMMQAINQDLTKLWFEVTQGTKKQQKKVVVVKRKKKQPPVDWRKRFVKVVRYAKAHPEKKWAFCEIYKNLFGSSPAGNTYRQFKEFAKNGYGGARISITGTRTYICSKDYNGSDKPPKRKSTKAKPGDKRVARMKYISGRANELVEQGHERNEALKIANQEYGRDKYMIRDKPLKPKTWDEKKIQMAERSTQKVKFPKIPSLEGKYQPVLIGMIKKVIDHKENYLAFVDAMAIGITKGKAYGEFMKDLAFNLGKIAEYYGVQNKFSFVGVGDAMVLKYNG